MVVHVKTAVRIISEVEIYSTSLSWMCRLVSGLFGHAAFPGTGKGSTSSKGGSESTTPFASVPSPVFISELRGRGQRGEYQQKAG